jgi:hypothetical protein
MHLRLPVLLLLLLLALLLLLLLLHCPCCQPVARVAATTQIPEVHVLIWLAFLQPSSGLAGSEFCRHKIMQSLAGR